MDQVTLLHLLKSVAVYLKAANDNIDRAIKLLDTTIEEENDGSEILVRK